MDYHDEETAEPLREVLELLREARVSDRSDAEVAAVMRTLRLTSAAIHALDQGEDEPTPAQVRAELEQTVRALATCP